MFGITVFLTIMVMKGWVSFWVFKILWIHKIFKNYLCIPPSMLALIHGMCFKETKKIITKQIFEYLLYVHVCSVVCCMFMYAQSCPSLCDPMDCNPPGAYCPWNFPGENTGVGCHFLDLWSASHLLHCLQWWADSFYHYANWEAHLDYTWDYVKLSSTTADQVQHFTIRI